MLGHSWSSQVKLWFIFWFSFCVFTHVLIAHWFMFCFVLFSCLLTHGLTCLLSNYYVMHTLTHSLTYLLTRQISNKFRHTFTYPTHTLTRSLTHSLNRWISNELTFTHSMTHLSTPHTHSLPYSFTKYMNKQLISTFIHSLAYLSSSHTSSCTHYIHE